MNRWLLLPLLPLCLAGMCKDLDVSGVLTDAGPDRVAHVGAPQTFSAEEGGACVWTFGDGATSQDCDASHTYDSPGHFTVVLERTREGSAPERDDAWVTVVHPPLEEAPRSSGALVASTDRLFSAMPDFDRVAVALTAETLDGDVRLRTLESCAGPTSLAVSEQRLAVSCPRADTVQLFSLEDPDAAPLDIHLPAGSAPFAVLLVEGALYSTLQGTGELIELSLGGQPLRSWPLGPDLRGLAWSDGQLLVTRHRSPDAEGRWWTVDLESGDVLAHSLAPDPGPDSDTDARGLPSYLQRVAVRPDGRVAVFPGLKANVYRGLATDGLIPTHETTVRAVLRQASLRSEDLGQELEEPHFDNRDLASAAAYNTLGDWLFVAHLGAEMVDVFDAVTMQRSGGVADVGAGPTGLWVSPEGTLWVLTEHGRELRAYDVSDLSASQTERVRVDLTTGLEEPLDPQVLLGKQVFHRSVDPRMSTDAYVSCASCHLDGSHDGRTWDFTDRGEGLRNTISLLDRGGTDHGPIHWSANFDEVQDFENDMRYAMAGDGFLSDGDWAECADTLGAEKAGRSPELDALAAYVTSLGPTPASPWADDGRIPEGEALFLSEGTGCADCHVPPRYTDSQWLETGVPLLHDVGTLTDTSGQRMGGALPGLDTPTLLGLHESAPYLHDGSAGALIQVLVDRNPDDLHGRTSHLSAAELGALEAFLLSLD